jgi:DNA-binding Lrp family transcriptional regulator
MITLDWLDKKIITRLLMNCRESYHSIARVFNVTCPTITYRVNQLRQAGIIQRFVAELSQETLGVDWILAELHVTKEVSKTQLLNFFTSNACIGDVFMLGRERYLVLVEVFPQEKLDFISCLKKLDGTEYIEISSIMPILIGQDKGNCRFTTRGDEIQLTSNDIKVLQFLVKNARTPIKTISNHTGLSQKIIRRIVRKFINCNGIHFTLQINLLQCGRINILVKTRLSDMRVDPDEIAQWVACRFPREHWFTIFAPRTDSLIHYMTVNHPPEIESILQEVLQHSQIDEVEASIIYSTLKSNGRTQQFLKKHLVGLTQEEWKPPLVATRKAVI